MSLRDTDYCVANEKANKDAEHREITAIIPGIIFNGVPFCKNAESVRSNLKPTL